MTTTEPQGPGPDAPTQDTGRAEVVRSEETLRVDTRTEVTGRVRVRKVVTSQEVTRTFTVRREELVVEHLPPGGGPVGAGSVTPASDGEDLELVLHEEQVVVVSVPVERVRVRVERVRDETVVTETIRQERIGLDVSATEPPSTDG